MRCFNGRSLVGAAAVFGLFVNTAIVSDPKPASDTTRAANEAVLGELPFDNTQDFEDTDRGFIASLPDNGVIKAENGDVVWDLSVYQFAEGKEAPDTVNPSLWRQLQLLAIRRAVRGNPKDLSGPQCRSGERDICRGRARRHCHRPLCFERNSQSCTQSLL